MKHRKLPVMHLVRGNLQHTGRVNAKENIDPLCTSFLSLINEVSLGESDLLAQSPQMLSEKKHSINYFGHEQNDNECLFQGLDELIENNQEIKLKSAENIFNSLERSVNNTSLEIFQQIKEIEDKQNSKAKLNYLTKRIACQFINEQLEKIFQIKYNKKTAFDLLVQELQQRRQFLRTFLGKVVFRINFAQKQRLSKYFSKLRINQEVQYDESKQNKTQDFTIENLNQQRKKLIANLLVFKLDRININTTRKIKQMVFDAILNYIEIKSTEMKMNFSQISLHKCQKLKKKIKKYTKNRLKKRLQCLRVNQLNQLV